MPETPLADISLLAYHAGIFIIFFKKKHQENSYSQATVNQ
jgi:hypothetical protein